MIERLEHATRKIKRDLEYGEVLIIKTMMQNIVSENQDLAK